MVRKVYGFEFKYELDILEISQPDACDENKIFLSEYDLVALKNMLCDLIEEIDDAKS